MSQPSAGTGPAARTVAAPDRAATAELLAQAQQVFDAWVAAGRPETSREFDPGEVILDRLHTAQLAAKEQGVADA